MNFLHALPWWKAPRHSAPAQAGLALHAAAPPESAPPVQIEGLRLAYGRNSRPVLTGLDWQLQPGQVVGLLGRNGAGKTTLLEALLGLREPQAGQVQLFGQPANHLDDAARARIGYVPQQSDLFEDLSPRQLLAYFRSFYPRWNEAKAEGLLSRWELPQDQLIGQLSVGQQQRLSIIRALAHEPDLLVLDEPVASLDPLGRRDFLRELVEQVLDRGTTVVFSTHILSDLERVAFNVAFLKGGRISLQGPLDELLEQCRWVQGPGAEAHGGELLARFGPRLLVRRPRIESEQTLVQAVTLEDLFEGLA
ncbi:ABC transporter ATP-binding protein [Inhella sp.]|uniref:ABC transporter ATP-binding protein n=1 Tax=Inhella sp. TaxID=1921806 RepID=UPI0035B1BC0F